MGTDARNSGFCRHRLILLLAVVLFVLAAAPRLMDLSANSLNVDEPVWMGRGRFVLAKLRQGDPVGATHTLRHPGVIPALLIGAAHNWLGKGVSPYSLGLLDRVAAARLPVAILGSLSCVLLFLLAARIWSPQVAFLAGAFLAFDPMHIALSRLAHVDSLLTLFFMLTLLTYFIGERENRLGWKVLSGVLLGCALATKEPAWILPAIVLAWKTVVWLRTRDRDLCRGLVPGDVLWLMAGFCTYALLFTQMWRHPDASAWLDPGGRFLPQLVICQVVLFLRRVPVAELSLVVLIATRWYAWKTRGKAGGLRGLVMPQHRAWASSALVVLILLMLRFIPYPIENVTLVLRRTYLFGTATEHAKGVVPAIPGEHTWMYYPVLMSLRLAEGLLLFGLLGAGLSATRFFRDRDTADRHSLPLVAILVFVLFMSVDAKHMALRYLLPVQPFLCILSAVGLAAAFNRVRRMLERRREILREPFWQMACVAVLLAIYTPVLISYFPNYYLFYNAFAGGPNGAKEHATVGWGEGYKESFDFLKAVAEGPAVNIRVWGQGGILKYYWEHADPPIETRGRINSRVIEESDYLVIVLNNLQTSDYRDTILEYMRTNTPLHTVTLQGVDMAWVYRLARVPVRGTVRYEAEARAMDHSVGTKAWDNAASGGACVTAVADKHERGLLLRGPFRTYAAGDYTATFKMRGSENSGEEPAVVLSAHVGDPRDVLCERVVAASEFADDDQYKEFPLSFTIPDQGELECRVLFCDSIDVAVDCFTVSPVAVNGSH